MKKFDMSDYFAGMNLLREYPVGKTFYMIAKNKILPVLIYECEFKYYDSYPDNNTSTKLNVMVSITGRVENNLQRIFPDELYETREEAAEAFLDKNDIPKKLLQVLNPPKIKTTVGDLIAKLQVVDPEIDLGNNFWKVLKPITRCIDGDATTDEYGEE